MHDAVVVHKGWMYTRRKSAESVQLHYVYSVHTIYTPQVFPPSKKTSCK